MMPQSSAPAGQDEFMFRSCLDGHTGRVTSISVSPLPDSNFFVSSSRDKKVLIWNVDEDSAKFARPFKSLVGHNHFVSDVQLSPKGDFAISSSWDKKLKLWDIEAAKCTVTFADHVGEVLSVAFSPGDGRQIVSGSSDGVIKIWNTRAECKVNLVEKGHQGWVSCVRFLPICNDSLMISSSWDGTVKHWNVGSEFSLRANYLGHNSYINTVTISPDGSLCASGGQDGKTMLWNLNDDLFLYPLETGDTVNALAFSPTKYWLCTASGQSVKIWNLATRKVISEIVPEIHSYEKYSKSLLATSLAWSANGMYLYVGYNDGHIRVWKHVYTPNNE